MRYNFWVGQMRLSRKLEGTQFSPLLRPIRSCLCIYAPRVSWIHFAITSRKKQEKSGRSIFNKKCGIIGLVLVTCCLCPPLFISTHRLCSGKRFYWRQYASTKTSPLYVRHALGHPPTDACSVNKAQCLVHTTRRTT